MTPWLKSTARTGPIHPMRLWLVVAVLCLLHVWMAASISRRFSTTVDEVAHLTAGYSYWTLQDYRLQPENGILPQRLCALPLLWQHVKFPSLASESWQQADVWSLGNLFFHESGNDLPAMLAAGRTMTALLSGLLCWSIFIFARPIFGTPAALLALILAVFSPTLLAHGGLITSDTAAALGFLWALRAWWRLLETLTLSRLCLAGLATGLLAISKHSAVLLAPMGVLLLGIRLWRGKSLQFRIGHHHGQLIRWKSLAGYAITLIVPIAIAIGLIWAAYGFRYAATAPTGGDSAPHFTQSWDRVLLKTPALQPWIMADGHSVGDTDPRPGIVQHFVAWSRDRHLLPEAWLYGLAFVEKNARGRLAFFAGDYRLTGWREFFPVLFALKTTLPALGLIMLGFAALFFPKCSQRRRRLLYQLSPIAILLIVYWAISITSRLNIGHRHLLPIYPACFILAAGSVILLQRYRTGVIALLALLLWHIGASLAIRPDYLAYFNSLAGGPAQAHRIAVDSSLDWGQDLPRLKQWLDQHAGTTPIFLSYFGSGSPVHEGIHATRIGDGYFDWHSRKTPPRLTGGTYCLSATMLRRVYTHVRGPWSADYEQAYQRHRAWLQHTVHRPPGQLPTEIDGSPMSAGTINDRLLSYEQLMFGRLCHYLDGRPNDASAGYSILVYRLSDNEVKFALEAPLEAINAAQTRRHQP